ncbi:MAG: hypothetical protein ACKVQA_26575, partial [Burkholderiales bacterium]
MLQLHRVLGLLLGSWKQRDQLGWRGARLGLAQRLSRVWRGRWGGWWWCCVEVCVLMGTRVHRLGYASYRAFGIRECGAHQLRHVLFTSRCPKLSNHPRENDAPQLQPNSPRVTWWSHIVRS